MNAAAGAEGAEGAEGAGRLVVACPACGVEREDHDGLGVLHCERCGFCTHSAATGDPPACDLCGAVYRAGEWITVDAKRYGVVLADPPWSYRNAGVRGAAAKQYPTMGDADVYALPVSELALPDAVLLLWATWPKLTEALRVIDAWQFEYVTCYPWIKVTSVSTDLFGDNIRLSVPYGIGHWGRAASEALLIARRGKVSPTTGNQIALLSPNLYHSRKPDSVYALAQSLPGPYVELFARRKRAGWDCWGDEIESDIELKGKG